MIFRQIVHDDLGCASYFVGDDDAGVAAVVDPRFEIGEYLSSPATSASRSTTCSRPTTTPTTSPATAGSPPPPARRSTSTPTRASSTNTTPFEDGWELELGAVRVRALHTPGHRPEHTAFALTDTDRGDEPWAVLTGDSLFVNDVARPDLAVEPEDGARAMYRTLHERLLTLPDDTARSGPATSAARCAAARAWT